MTKYKHLLKQFKPDNYQLELDIDKDEKVFSGTVKISGELVKSADHIDLHAKELKITSSMIGRVPAKSSNHDHDVLSLKLPETINAGAIEISLSFEGKITDAMNGIYPCYFSNDGAQDFLIATQFESHHARKVFPCVDEPSAKATFDLTLTTPKGLTVLSNTLPTSTKDVDNKSVTTFSTTPIMSTYLLAFVVGEMHSVERKTKSGTLIRSFSTVAQDKSHLEWSADEGVKIIEFYEDYFGVDFPLDKCDQVALPDFDAGAMENWGLITYREIALLVDPNNPSISSQQYVSLVVAHELSHQWFGNLVTMKWLDDLWLNESFASIMEHVALDAIHPEWNQWEIYASSDIISTTNRDIHRDIQPVSLAVEDPDLIETLFDPGIVYAKGARLIKMLIDYIGDEDFQKGIKIYFERLAYKNATREDLWAAIAEASGKDVSSLMTPWLFQPGMPIIKVLSTEDNIEFTQKRFIADGSSDDSIWPIPLLSPVFDDQVITIGNEKLNIKSHKPVIINPDGSGHYVTDYDSDDLLEQLATAMAAKSISAAGRINTLNDQLLMARSGDSQTTFALETILQMKQEDRNAVWNQISRVVATTISLTEGNEEAKDQINKLMIELAGPLHRQLGWNDNKDDDANTKQLRITILELMISSDDQDTLTKVDQFVKETSPEKLPADLRHAYLASRIKHGDDDLAERLMDTFHEATQEVQLDYSIALTSTRDPKLASKIINRSIGHGGFARPQDTFRWIIYLVRNYHTRQIMWDYMVDNWKQLQEIFETSKSFDYIPSYTAMMLNTEEWLANYKNFFEPKKDIKAISRNIIIGIADIESRVAWRKREEAEVTSWLEERFS